MFLVSDDIENFKQSCQILNLYWLFQVKICFFIVLHELGHDTVRCLSHENNAWPYDLLTLSLLIAISVELLNLLRTLQPTQPRHVYVKDQKTDRLLALE